jgi:hypothetical protein
MPQEYIYRASKDDVFAEVVRTIKLTPVPSDSRGWNLVIADPATGFIRTQLESDSCADFSDSPCLTSFTDSSRFVTGKLEVSISILSLQ